jgi:Mg-chelatase subunit ChlI
MNHVLFPDGNLSNEQQAAIDMALTQTLSILTGGPGTGKTTCLKALIHTLEDQGKKYALASPPGARPNDYPRRPENPPAPFIAFWNSHQWKASSTTMIIR